MAADARDRALGALYGLAIGDALGMPTQDLTREQIRADYGEITGFVDAGPHQRIARGALAGTVTDDTEQMLLVARMLAERGRIEPVPFAQALADWEDGMRARGSLDLLGPSTSAAIAKLRHGATPGEAGTGGTTNGAAMRIAPVGIANPPLPEETLIDRVEEASLVTHNTSLGISAAAAIAAAVSAGVAGLTRDEALDHGISAAAAGSRRGRRIAGPSIAARAPWAIAFVRQAPDTAYAVYDVIGTTVASQESVVAALAVCATIENPWDAVCLAAGAGGDTDTVAAMVGAICGATTGMTAWPAHAVGTVKAVNGLELEPLVDALLALRSGLRSGLRSASRSVSR